MLPAPVGTRIRVVRNDANHSYTVGVVYTVANVDDDGTFRATDAAGRTGNWLRWTECEPAGGAAWPQIAADMPEPLIRFLSCFDGISEITVKEAVIDAVLEKLPDLHERILAAAGTSAGGAAIAANWPRPTEQPAEKPEGPSDHSPGPLSAHRPKHR